MLKLTARQRILLENVNTFKYRASLSDSTDTDIKRLIRMQLIFIWANDGTYSLTDSGVTWLEEYHK